MDIPFKEVSQSLPNQVNDFNPTGEVYTTPPCTSRNPFQTRSTTSIGRRRRFRRRQIGCRNPFQTRSTTSILKARFGSWEELKVAIPSKPGQRLQYQ